MSSNKKTMGTKEDGKPALAPKLRFPEFSNKAEWRVRKLNELLFETKTRNRLLELGPTDVLSVSGEHGCVNQIEFMGRSYAGVSVKDYHVVEHGDVVYTKSPLKRNPFGIIKENKGKRGIVSTLYAVYRPFPDCSATYLDHFFSGDYNLNSYLQPIVKKGAKNDMKVNNADVLKGDICVPEFPEQQKIAACMSSVDEVIAAQARKVDALKTHKKGLMQQLFPREGETQPRLRFPKFQNDGEWVQKPLGKVATYENGKAHENDILEVGQYIVVNSKFISTEGAVRKYSDLAFCPAGAGNILMVLSDVPNGRAIAKCFFVDRDETYTVNQRICKIVPNQASSRFLFYVLDRNSYFLAFDDGVKQTNLRKDDVLNCPLCLPSSLAEQQRIASCLSSLDALITAETHKLETLMCHKRGLMQQLFPSPEEAEA